MRPSPSGAAGANSRPAAIEPVGSNDDVAEPATSAALTSVARLKTRMREVMLLPFCVINNRFREHTCGMLSSSRGEVESRVEIRGWGDLGREIDQQLSYR